MQSRLFRRVDLGQEDTYQPFAPTLRDASFNAGLNTILMRIEDVVGLGRGSISDASMEAKTATEIKSMKQRAFQTNKDIQDSLEDTLKDVIYIMNAYCDLYEVTPDGKYDVNFEWDDSILVDVDTELNKRLSLMNAGLTSKVEVRMWYFGETKRQAEQALQEIEKQSMQDMENDMIMQSNSDQSAGKFGQPRQNEKAKVEE
jgi:A118 family predicted phage portal protein